MKHDPDTPTIWQALDEWAKKLKPWQRQILAFAIQNGRLSPEQIETVYELFKQEHGLAQRTDCDPITLDVSGRPANVLIEKLRLERVDELAGVNALPVGAALTFCQSLTIVYGKNGAGKSGFARVFANACFSRHKPNILCNIYEESTQPDPAARFNISLNGVAQEPITFAVGKEIPELKRLSFFDTTVARLHISQAAPFEFRPSGFDVFPEMARAFALLAEKLDADIKSRTSQRKFLESFIGPETSVSKAISALDASNNELTQIRQLASYGESEDARLAEVDRQLTALKSKSPKEAIASAKEARADILSFERNLKKLADFFSATQATRRTTISETAKKAVETAALLSTEQFRRPFFNAIGSVEWEQFAKAAYDLAKKEDTSYPQDQSHCLLCERPLDEASRKHVDALLTFVEGDAQRATKLAEQFRTSEITEIDRLNCKVLAPDSRTRSHLHRLDPTLETQVDAFIESVEHIKSATITALTQRAPITSSADVTSISAALSSLVARLDQDVELLEKENTAEAIAQLDLEHKTLRHRKVLSQLLVSIESFVADRIWRQTAERARSSLNPRGITEKEKELFGKIIGETYKERLAAECEELQCVLPVVPQTAGQKGKTVRSLHMKGGYSPESILSEGEQRAVALADFLTEVTLNPANAGIILDDPVNSQDHQRKELIAKRLVGEARERQVIVFTHDLVFLNNLVSLVEKEGIEYEAHWIERESGSPAHVVLNDAPATGKAYDTAERAKGCLAQAKTLVGRPKQDAICTGMGALRRKVEEAVVKKLLKNVVPRWSDRVIVTGLRNVAWDDGLVEDLCSIYEELSKYIEGHSHTDEATGAPPEIKDLEQMIIRVENLIKRAKQDRKKVQQSAAAA
jgi:ABC-type transport system involved in cytochrome c biogenesis ATPase subunit